MSIFLEIGPGRGDFLFHLALENLTTTIVGVEYKKKRLDKLTRRIEDRKLTNVQLFLGDARVVLPQEFADSSVEKIFILFSDPWPKRKHAKHRLFQEPFVKELLRILKPGGLIFVAHDDPRYVAQIKTVFKKFTSSLVFLESGVEFWTFYAEKWKKEGRTIASFSYQKRDCNSDDDFLSVPCEISKD